MKSTGESLSHPETSNGRAAGGSPPRWPKPDASPPPAPPFACDTKDRGHGRIEHRHTRVFAIEPLACGLPHMRSLVVVTKRVGSTSREANKESGETASHYLSTLVPQSAARFARLVRGLWGGCEIRNHWVRDALFEEDATLSKNLNLNGNLAVLRCALIALKTRHAAHLT